MKYLSLFSGIEAVSVAWKNLDLEPVAFAEIEPFCCELLSQRFPDVLNLGDISLITESEIRSLGQIDLIVFGSPCQDLSVAGKREGLSGERSGLFRAAIRIIHWANTYNGCRFALWENVPGTFSSNQGSDFSEVLRLFTGAEHPAPEKGWQTSGAAYGPESLCEWRILDAQYFGVPQRRRRLFAFVDFGNWEHRQPVLFESTVVCRDFAKGRKERQDITGPLEARTTAGGFPGTDGACANHVIPVPYDMQRMGIYGDGHKASSLKQRDYKDATDLVISFNPKDDPVYMVEKSVPLQAQGCGNSSAVVIPIHDQATRYNGKRADKQDGKGNGLGIGEPGAVMNTLTSGDQHAVSYDLTVRRLTPIECERLQGLPDNWTQIAWRKKPAEQCPATPRYKCIGNSMAVPVINWLGRRILSECSGV